MSRSKDEIIADLKRIWGENWQLNMEIISDAVFHNRADLPQTQIDASNNLVWEIMGTVDSQ